MSDTTEENNEEGHDNAEQEAQETEASTEGSSEEKVLSDMEQMALDGGWRSNGKRSAKEYVRFAMDQLPIRGQQLHEMNLALKGVTSLLERREEIDRKQVVDGLDQQRREAISVGDHELVDQREKQKVELVEPVPISLYI